MGERGAMPKYEYEQMFGPDKATYGPQGSQIVYETGGLGGVVTIANGLFAVVMIAALARGEYGAIAAIVTGGLYYGITTIIALVVLSGTLTQIVVNRQEQVTLRQYHQLQVSIVQPTALPDSSWPRPDHADPLQLPGTPPAPTAPPLGGVTYVAAEDLTIRRNAALWAATLYGSDGLPNPKMVHLDAKRERPGRLRIAAPAKAQREWLESKKVLESIPHGVRLRVERYPDADTLRNILNG